MEFIVEKIDNRRVTVHFISITSTIPGKLKIIKLRI